jgi:hypothetical protein
MDPQALIATIAYGALMDSLPGLDPQAAQEALANMFAMLADAGYAFYKIR